MNFNNDFCEKCNSCVIIYYSSLNKKVCADCNHEWKWELKEGQTPIIKYQR